MSKEKINWETDIKKGLEDAKNIKDIKLPLKQDSDRRKIDGFNPGDVGKK
ncbi:MAG: hypothetical protein ABIE07_09775 [Candidatus Zixiibacteriota bacterium]